MSLFDVRLSWQYAMQDSGLSWSGIMVWHACGIKMARWLNARLSPHHDSWDSKVTGLQGCQMHSDTVVRNYMQ